MTTRAQRGAVGSKRDGGGDAREVMMSSTRGKAGEQPEHRKYLATFQYELKAVDDVEARSAFFKLLHHFPFAKGKLQEIYDDKPPRGVKT